MAATTLRRLACLLAFAALPALAQHVWLDEKGVRQYSDQPPPAGTPASRILQSAGPRPASPAPTAAPSGPTLAERNADFEKRRIERAEREQKESEQAAMEKEKKSNCEQARAYGRALANGGRIARTDANGERSYLTDAQRAEETARVQRTLEQCRSAG
ncbi:DUF4124 domain-containing protein|uniref:DUF4124 domain-containing protein n=1 Tax=Noviherbaspirillum sp. L7-7A TaxID=2850560 RepID=UPI001C2BBB92|nr:DUF4124 domain-containing protein [Noviherbaspirillum sp. L7-7A]MBV0878763.1 DUF4124 domain-containing protein [Noviherbaspirillum sp. L7-7A]